MLIIAVLLAWALCLLLFGPRLMRLSRHAAGWLDILVLGTFLTQLSVFWLFGAYFVIQGLFAILRPRLALVEVTTDSMATGVPSVAILYTTRNDFNEGAVLSCIEQDYPNCCTFILDDSLDPVFQSVIDRFVASQNSGLELFRRQTNIGFKAGNLNHGLAKIADEFEYFIVVDADNVLPLDFVARLVEYANGDDRLAFVQASHAPLSDQPSQFADELCLQTLCMWQVFCRTKNRYGLPLFLGHGGLVRTAVWAEVGGFPHLSAEDLSFTTQAAEFGHRGLIAADVTSYEEFPIGYREFRRQQMRYVKGVTQYLHRQFWSFLWSRRVTWFEKVDVALACGTLLLPVVFFTFMVVYCLIMPFRFGVTNVLTVHAFGQDMFSFPVVLLTQRFYDVAFSWDYFLVTILCTFAPAIGTLPVIRRYRLKGLKMFILSTCPFLSLLVGSTWTVVSYAIWRTSEFVSTGEKVSSRTSQHPTAAWLGSESWLLPALEIILGLVMLVMCIVTLNLCLAAFAVATLLAPVMLRVRWGSPWLRPFLYLPFFLLVGGIILGGTTLFSVQGAYMSGLFFHF